MKLPFGQSGEKKAAKYLQKKGYSILERNFRSRFGEIDIIAEKDGVTVFVEVKTRSTEAYGKGFESVRPDKQGKLIKTAQHYMSVNGECPARFDVVSIDENEITHIEDAFC